MSVDHRPCRTVAFLCLVVGGLVAAGLAQRDAFASVAGSSIVPEVQSSHAIRASTPWACVNLVENGGFEQGAADPAPWLAGGFTHVSEEQAHGGYYGMWMGGYREANDTLYQLVTVPSEADETNLSYWWHMQSLDDAETPYDYLYVTLQTADGEVLAELEILDNTDRRNVWSQSTIDVGALAGTTFRIGFDCVGNGAFVTSFFLDDVELIVCGPSETPAPTQTATPRPSATSTAVPGQLRYLPLVWLGPLD